MLQLNRGKRYGKDEMLHGGFAPDIYRQLRKKPVLGGGAGEPIAHATEPAQVGSKQILIHTHATHASSFQQGRRPIIARL